MSSPPPSSSHLPPPHSGAPAVLSPAEMTAALRDLATAVREIHLFLAGPYGPQPAAPPATTTGPLLLPWQPPHLAPQPAAPPAATTGPLILPWQPPHLAPQPAALPAATSHPVPSPRQPSAGYPPNNLLQGLEKLGEGQLSGPEDVYVDAAAGGTLYTATRDGWLQRMQPNGTWGRWPFVGGEGLLGIAPSADGSMLVCDAYKGLLRVEDEGCVTILASTVEGSPIRFADAAIEASDGTVYFSDGSTRFGHDRWFLDYLEASSTGRLLKYDPSTGKASVMLNNLAFANGVALSQDETFVVVCESWRFRCMKLWLKGDKAGLAETFIDNLPGSPDNIRLAPDGSFWIALLQLRSPWIDLVMRWTFTKRVFSSFQALLDVLKETAKGAMVAQVTENGEIIRVLGDSEGKVINFITSATEYGGNLFLGSLSTNFVGKMSLAKVPQVQEVVSS